LCRNRCPTKLLTTVQGQGRPAPVILIHHCPGAARPGALPQRENVEAKQTGAIPLTVQAHTCLPGSQNGVQTAPRLIMQHVASCYTMPTTWSAPTRLCARIGQDSMHHPRSSPVIAVLTLRALVHCCSRETLQTGGHPQQPAIQAHTSISKPGCAHSCLGWSMPASVGTRAGGFAEPKLQTKLLTSTESSVCQGPTSTAARMGSAHG